MLLRTSNPPGATPTVPSTGAIGIATVKSAFRAR
jgi:hypothetical protein